VKVAFVSGNREQLPDAVIPLGLLYLLASCPAHHDAVLWDLCFEQEPHAALAKRLGEFRPDLVALGIRNLQRNDYSGGRDNIECYRSLMHTIRAASSVPVVVGGGGFSVMPEGWMRELACDFGIVGEGERALAQLLGELEAPEPSFLAVPGLLHWVDGALVANPRARDFLDLDALPVPDRRQVDARYFERSRIESVQTKRGCSLDCAYCTYPTIEGRTVRARSPRRVVDELCALRALHPSTEHLFVVDSVFNLPPSHAKAVCRELCERGWSLPWTCYANPNGFDAELAALMVQAGCAGIEVGADSGCDHLLRTLRKGFDTAALRQLHVVATEAGLRDCHTFMLGTPGESLDDVRRTLDFMVELDPFATIVMIWTDDAEAGAPAVEPARRELRAGIVRLLEQHATRRPRWVVPATGLNFEPKLFAALRKMGLRGPLWQHLDRAEERWRRLSGLRSG
jgi:radical SAM superfamily enzyme YgiQ (UPF0313 family)